MIDRLDPDVRCARSPDPRRARAPRCTATRPGLIAFGNLDWNWSSEDESGTGRHERPRPTPRSAPRAGRESCVTHSRLILLSAYLSLILMTFRGRPLLWAVIMPLGSGLGRNRQIFGLDVACEQFDIRASGLRLASSTSDDPLIEAAPSASLFPRRPLPHAY